MISYRTIERNKKLTNFTNPKCPFCNKLLTWNGKQYLKCDCVEDEVSSTATKN